MQFTKKQLIAQNNLLQQRLDAAKPESRTKIKAKQAEQSLEIARLQVQVTAQKDQIDSMRTQVGDLTLQLADKAKIIEGENNLLSVEE